MRSPTWLFAITAFLLLLATSHVAADSRLLTLRDEPAPSTTRGDTAAPTSHERAAKTAEPPAESRASSKDGDSDNNNNSTSSNGAASSTMSSASFSPSPTILAPNSTDLNLILSNGTMAAPGELPLPPTITPALSVAGVLLMLSGAVYCLIGIKNKWIQIFISVAYLTSLAIVVLILYVMKPPITNAIQGAYLAAIAAPALLLGGGALIFRDVTEGLGCAIGGFSLSMFFLVLKPGGLIGTQVGVAIFIGVFTAVSFACSFSRYTRSYGIIAASAMGGSTAVVLGIDCFSRAGLKEFWVYIWDLNDDLFPLLQDTYPITRGMRVELAGIVVFTFFGVLSQLRIWKVIEARRERKEQERIEANRERDELEAQIGRDVEAGNDRDRGQWEAIYGEKDHRPSDSGIGTDVGSTRKGSYSTTRDGKHVEAIELDQLNSPTGTEHVIRVAADDAPAPSIRSKAASIKVGTTSVTSRAASIVSESAISTPKEFATADSVKEEPEPKQELPAKPLPARTASPKVIPLPFKILENVKDDDDVASNATFNDSEHGSTKQRYSQRFSGMHLMRKLSQRSKRDSIKTTSSVEALVDPDMAEESDRGFSLSSRSPSPNAETRIGSEMFMTPNEQPFSFDFDEEVKKTAAAPTNDTAPAPLTLAALGGDKSASTSKQVVENDAGHESDASEKRAPSIKSKKSTKSRASTASLHDLKSHLPNDASKVVMQFRTNEWAKHLSHADQPDFDELPPIEPIVEESAPANPKALLQTAMTAEPQPAPLPKPAKQPTKTPPTIASSGPAARIPSFSLNGASSPKMSPTASVTSLSDTVNQSANNTANSSANASRTSLHAQQQHGARRSPSALALRSTSSPLIHTPIDEDAEATFHTPLPTDTLLAHRGTLLDRKHMTGSTGNLTSRPGSSASSGPGMVYAQGIPHPSSASLVGSAGSTASNSPVLGPEDDNISLSARKAALKQRSSSSLRQQTASPLLLPTATYTSANTPSHSPHLARSSTDPALRRASMLAAWRQGIAEDVQKNKGSETEVDKRRGEMWESRKREQQEMERRKANEGGWGSDKRASHRSGMGSRAGERGSKRMSNMSGREINDAHREVLRKMQAGANRKLKEGGE